jgi:hypothetical protein
MPTGSARLLVLTRPVGWRPQELGQLSAQPSRGVAELPGPSADQKGVQICLRQNRQVRAGSATTGEPAAEP